MHAIYAIFWRGRTFSDLTLAVVGANGANAAFIPAIFLKGERRSMNTIPMLNICTPPPDMYNINACIGRDLAGEIARSQARFSFNDEYDDDDDDTAVGTLAGALELGARLENPGGGGRFLHLLWSMDVYSRLK